MLETAYVLHRVREICERRPDRSNPTVPIPGKGLGCMYQREDNPEDNCLIGTLAREEGWVLPPFDDFAAANIVAVRFGWPIDERTGRLLTVLQRKADAWDSDHIPRPWGEVMPLVDDLLANLRVTQQAELAGA